jgi:hypothetical protein
MLVYTSAFYPQGNSINESSHNALDAMLSTCATIYNIKFSDALRAAVAVHNATPHVATGMSPFYALMGFEPSFPGAQLFANANDMDHSRLVAVNQARAQAVARANFDSQQDLKVIPPLSYAIGDWVVYLLPNYERKVKENLATKFTKIWSLPAKIVAVKDKVLDVAEWPGRKIIQVPLSKVRILQGSVPESLREVNLMQLESHLAPVLRNIPKRKNVPSTPWSEFLQDASKSLLPHANVPAVSSTRSKRVRYQERNDDSSAT